MAENTTTQTTEQESAFSSLVKPIIVLVVICVVCSLLLAVLNSKTAPIIEENTIRETMAAYVGVMPEGTDENSLTELDTSAAPAGVEGAMQSADGVVAVKSAATGYGGKAVTVYVAFDTTGAITNISVDASTQTTGLGSKTGDEKFYGGFIGATVDTPVANGSPVDAVAGATISSNACYTAINAAMDYYKTVAGVA